MRGPGPPPLRHSATPFPRRGSRGEAGPGGYWYPVSGPGTRLSPGRAERTLTERRRRTRRGPARVAFASCQNYESRGVPRPYGDMATKDDSNSYSIRALHDEYPRGTSKKARTKHTGRRKAKIQDAGGLPRTACPIDTGQTRCYTGYCMRSASGSFTGDDHESYKSNYANDRQEEQRKGMILKEGRPGSISSPADAPRTRRTRDDAAPDRGRARRAGHAVCTEGVVRRLAEFFVLDPDSNGRDQLERGRDQAA